MVHHDHEVAELSFRAVGLARVIGAPVGLASAAGAAGGDHDRAAGRSGIWAAAGTVLARWDAAPDRVARAAITARELAACSGWPASAVGDLGETVDPAPAAASW